MSSSPVDGVTNAAKDFEQKHYKDTNEAGEAEQLTGQDFKNAAASAGDAVTNAVTSVKEAIVGKDDQYDAARTSPASDQAPPADASADSPPLTETIPNKIAATLESMEQAVKPNPNDTKTDPEVNEFKSLVAEVFSNMKESIAVSAPASATAPPSNTVGPTTPITDTPASEPSQQESKTVASSPVEAQQSLLLQMKEAGVMFAEALVPTACAAGRTPGDSASPSYEGGVGEGESKGLIQDLGETAEAALQAVVHQRDAHPGTRPADEKWADAKEETRESGRQATAAARDAASALGSQVDRWGNKVAEKADEAGEKVDKWGRQTKEEAYRAGDRAEDALYNTDAKFRGVAAEVEDLTRNAAERVKGDYQDLKRHTKEMANNSTTALEHERLSQKIEKEKEGGGLFGWLKNLGGGGGNNVDDAAERARANGRAAADDIKDSARSARETVQDKAQEGKENVRGWFGAASDQADDVAARARRSANRTADEVSDKAQEGKDKASGWFGAASDSVDDASRRARRSAERASEDVRFKAEEGKENARGWFNSGRSAADDAAYRGRRHADRASDKAEYYADRAGDKAEHFADKFADQVNAAGDSVNHYARRAGNEVSRFGSRVSDAAEDAENWAKDKVNEVEDYVTADLRPRSSWDASVQSGYIPSNTADVQAARFRSRR